MAFDFVGDLVEPIAGHLVGRFKSRPRTAVHLSMFLVSLLVGLVFFVGYGVYELLFPAPNPMKIWGGHWVYPLLLISAVISLFVYVILIIDYYTSRKRPKI
ncbi:hypothetical protein [Serpentinimonas maccroryi]|jgi:hypothetical protein|uniref:hypothetical protein n=1 Tax=Serpentinimonas maccroryi TaxID=1458426 RepID=UPI0020339AC9|nr:hypothetical protein [Serpentinimonas maccroryi]MCM2480264.1 hypothetical protein [Serpentinimonas maccroryi]MDO9612851.1 hypothetical protein [Serpentinimonas sp.]